MSTSERVIAWVFAAIIAASCASYLVWTSSNSKDLYLACLGVHAMHLQAQMQAQAALPAPTHCFRS